jgi:hypothetical protein
LDSPRSFVETLVGCEKKKVNQTKSKKIKLEQKKKEVEKMVERGREMEKDVGHLLFKLISEFSEIGNHRAHIGVIEGGVVQFSSRNGFKPLLEEQVFSSMKEKGKRRNEVKK